MTKACCTPSARPRPNRLAGEKSPYLLQHRFNPVDWYPWGPEAFARARDTRRPIFLSVGYSTCHWCHVMERESFENEAVARCLNAHFVCIKVDREERPDIDRLYMTFVQATTGQGGWPMTVLLTPDLKPFFGGTYFPPENRGGQPGLLDVLEQVQTAWASRQADVLKSADGILRHLQTALATPGASDAASLSPPVLAAACAAMKAAYDPQHGGFGRAPKFPQPSRLLFLLRHGVAAGDREAVRMVFHTCQSMAAGGIHDQLGGGFARYATDTQWRVPHFEKMLYDNALLTQLYTEARQAGGPAGFAEVARDILAYVRRDMTGPDGEFYSAEDADSEGREGRFYCWTRDEMAAVLTPAEFDAATRHFGVTREGNFVDHSDPAPLPGQNVLSVSPEELNGNPIAPQGGAPTAREMPGACGSATLLASAQTKLLAARSRRIRPHRDDKVLASWNGLMLGALACAHAALGDPAFLDTARRNLAFLRSRIWDPATRTLHHRWRDGERDAVQLLGAYACVLSGVVDLYETTLEPQVLAFGIELADAMLARFHDPANGGFWQTPPDCADLILRTKEDSDGAEPSGNAVAVLALLRLAAITGQAGYRQAAEGSLRFHAGRLRMYPEALPHLLLGAAFALAPAARVVIAGDAASPAGQALLHAAHADYRPFLVVMGTAGPVDAFARTLPALDGKPTAYACIGTSCQLPTLDGGELRRCLAAMPSQAAAP